MRAPSSFVRLAPLLVALVGCARSADAEAPVPLVTAAPDEPSTPDEPGTLDILCMPRTKVLVDGVLVGTTPIRGYKVAPGRHDVTFIDDETGNRTMTVRLEAGEGKTVKSERPPTPIEQKP